MSDGNYLTFFVFSDKLADGAPKVQVRSFTEKVSSNKKAKVGEELPATDAHSDSPHGVSAKIAAYKTQMNDEVLTKVDKLKQQGWENKFD